MRSIENNMEKYVYRLWQQGKLNVIPINPDGSKSPPAKWRKAIRSRLHPFDWVSYWRDGYACAIVCGESSGNMICVDGDWQNADGLEVLDDDAALLPELKVPWELLTRLVIVRTPKKGHHVYYRCSEYGPGRVLAGTQEGRTRIETRGQGHYVLCPCSVIAHDSGKPYELIQGDLCAIPTITPEERAVLLNAARAFDERPVGALDHDQVPKPKHQDGGYRSWWTSMGIETPWMKFNRLASWDDLLEPQGWEEVRSGYWRRPGKDGPGISATTDRAAEGCFYVFSTDAAPFEVRGYDKSEVFSLLWCEGDRTRAYHLLDEFLTKTSMEKPPAD